MTTRLASHFSSQNFSGFPHTLPHSICVGQILSDDLIKNRNIEQTREKDIILETLFP